MSEPKTRRWWRWALELAAMILVVLAVQWYQARDAASGPAPALAGQLLDGRQVQWEVYRGRPLLVHFWATWCPVCGWEQQTIHRLAANHQVLTVALDGAGSAELLRYLAEQGVDYPVLPDPGGERAATYGVQGVPASFVVDGKGDIRSVAIGYTTEWGLRLRLWWAGVVS